jgi:adenylate kinase
MKKGRKFIVIIIGPPGAGKGTQAELLAEKLGLYYFETSRILEESWAKAKKEDYVEADGGEKFFLLDEKKLFDTGILCSPPFVSFVVRKKIKELADQNRSLVIAGSPRTLYEGKEVMPLMIDLYGAENILVLELKISDRESIWRNSRRKLCSKCRYPVPFTSETQNLKRCPKCGGELVTRTLDSEDVIKVRLDQYKERTYPLFEYFKELGIVIKEINGEQSIEDVFKDILKAVE